MRQTIRKITTILVLLVFLFSAWQYIDQSREKAGGNQAYENAMNIATQEPTDSVAESSAAKPTEAVELPSEAETEQQMISEWIPVPLEEEDEHITMLQDISLEALQAVNPDVVGWIYLPDSEINYPIMQGEDNEFYLERTWEKEPNHVGSIFLECKNDADFSDFNTIIYGHNMRNGSMFASIRKFEDPKYLEQHPYIYIVTEEGVFRYEVYSSYKAPIDSPAYGLSFNQKETREEFFLYALEHSVKDTGVIPQLSDRIVTLSTCTGNGYDSRWVVHARLAMQKVERPAEAE